jgi:hypothetical protein
MVSPARLLPVVHLLMRAVLELIPGLGLLQPLDLPSEGLQALDLLPNAEDLR